MNSTRLFQALDPFARRVMDSLPKALDKVMPQNRAQSADLPNACRDLSNLLTQERAELHRPYWSSPRLTAAYLRYFLPWNLLRMGALLPGLDLNLAMNLAMKLGEQSVIVDLGSGPLTLGLALWMSRPDLRALPLTLVAADSSPRPLDLGKKLFLELLKLHQPDCPWKIRTVKASIQRALGDIKDQPDLLCLGNVLNEWDGQARPDGQGQRLDGLVQDFRRHLRPGGQILAIEPGTRLGGKMVAMLRQAAQPVFAPLSPCPHNRVCPMLSGRHTAWCHFGHKPDYIPDYLEKTSRLAGLGKQSVSLSFVQLGANPEKTKKPDAAKQNPDQNQEGLAARVVSNPFSLPGRDGPVCYLCTARGLGLLVDEKLQAPGNLLSVKTIGPKDGKSGALLMRLA